MLVTTILAMALTTQAAKAQPPTNEQQRLKALAAKIHQESLAKKAQAKPKPTTPAPAPVIQYVEVPQVEPRSLLYLWTEGLSSIPIFADRSQVRAMQKALLADDDAAIAAYVVKTRLPVVPIGTAVRVTRIVEQPPSETLSTRTFARELQAAQLSESSGTQLPVCEVLILDGPFKDRKGWVLEYHLRDRVEVNLKKAKRHR